MLLKPKDLPKPGSKIAVQNGCTCSVYDNHYGAGYGGDGEKFGWVMLEKCPLHSPDHTEVYEPCLERNNQ